LRARGAASFLIVMAAAGAAATATAAALDVRLLRGTDPQTAEAAILSGSLDDAFAVLPDDRMPPTPAAYWLRIRAALPDESSTATPALAHVPVLVLHTSRQTDADVFVGGASLRNATVLAGFRGTQDRVFVLPPAAAQDPVFVRVRPAIGDARGLRVFESTLAEMLERGAEHSRMICLAVGALVSMALAALSIWFVLRERLFILYSTLFLLQALYIAFLSGQAFDWPVLALARPLTSFAWNVPVGLSGAVSCLFTREITDLERFWPRIYSIFGWMAVGFGVLTIANVAKLFGYGSLVNAVGNVIFCGLALFTLIVAFLSWRRGNRAAGWFLIAWTLLEGFTIAVAARFLLSAPQSDESDLFYYGMPASMVVAAILIALGVADRLRQQRDALTEAERRAQTDPLTGVLNRRSFVERLDAACVRARARGLPITLLFLDLDHFKSINDSFGHAAGDACLRAVIEPIHAELRQSDVIGRYGGEEFVVLLSSADAAAAAPIAERIRERVANVRVEGFGAPIRMSCSIGVAASDALGVWGEHLIARADAAVYLAKRSGRNQVQMAYPMAPAP
jgi:diguanylate cyclase (GGDEF)-like protein